MSKANRQQCHGREGDRGQHVEPDYDVPGRTGTGRLLAYAHDPDESKETGLQRDQRPYDIGT
jgi:hypothetical protein